MTVQDNQHCFGCKFLKSHQYCDGTTEWVCTNYPGWLGEIVIGEQNAFTDDKPIRCKDYERE